MAICFKKNNLNTPTYIVNNCNNSVLYANKDFNKFWEVDSTDKIELAYYKSELFFSKCNDYCFFNQKINQKKSASSFDLGIIGLPFSSGSLNLDSSVSNFPDKLRRYSNNFPSYINIEDGSSSGIYDIGKHKMLFNGIHFRDFGDIQGEWDNVSKHLIKNILEMKVFPIFIGGDHSVTFWTIEQYLKITRNGIIIIDIDAHHDCRNNLNIEKDLNNANFVWHLLKRENINAIIQVGVRGIRSLSQVLNDEKLFQIDHNARMGKKLSSLLNILKRKYPTSSIFLSIDLDIIEPTYFPFVDFPISDGLNLDEILKIFQIIFKSKFSIFGIDIVEGNDRGEDNDSSYYYPLYILCILMEEVKKRRFYEKKSKTMLPGKKSN